MTEQAKGLLQSTTYVCRSKKSKISTDNAYSVVYVKPYKIGCILFPLMPFHKLQDKVWNMNKI